MSDYLLVGLASLSIIVWWAVGAYGTIIIDRKHKARSEPPTTTYTTVMLLWTATGVVSTLLCVYMFQRHSAWWDYKAAPFLAFLVGCLGALLALLAFIACFADDNETQSGN